ncbi:MAG: hypothetical protein ACRDSR_20240, partial [Pseudonocardiaceae bacterium]
ARHDGGVRGICSPAPARRRPSPPLQRPAGLSRLASLIVRAGPSRLVITTRATSTVILPQLPEV